MTVAFAAPVQVGGPLGRSLWFEGNGKITAGNGTFDCPAANSFSLIHVADCPGSTATCRASCYVHGLEEAEPEVYALYRSNSATMRQILAGGERDERAWALRVAMYITENAAAGFRWHVSGDIFSAAYARWIALVVRLSPDVRHWIYTRSHSMIGPLVHLPNLALNLSCDRDNYRPARFARALYPERRPRLCYLVDSTGEVPSDLPVGSVLFPDYEFRGRDLTSPLEGRWWGGLTPAQRRMVCPVDYFGPSKSIRCGTCRKCF